MKTQVIKRMDSLIAEWDQRNDRRSEFLRCYRLMTANMLAAIEANEFHDGPWVNHLLTHFADYYFAALTVYEENRQQAPVVWMTTHQQAANPAIPVLHNLLLGINAHINYDLVLTLYDILSPEWPLLQGAIRQQRYEDHRKVNAVIGRTVDAVQETIVEPQAPLMDIADKLLGPVDEWTASLVISHWREDVWKQTERMLAAQTELERELLRQEIEKVTMERARKIAGSWHFDLL